MRERYNVNRLEEAAYKLKKPYGLLLEITQRCNLNCIHCYNTNHVEYGIEKDKVFEIISTLRKMGLYEVTLTGGEIFCRKDTMEIIKFLRERYLSVQLNTNLNMVTDDLIEELSELGITLISTTIYSMNKNVHDAITRTDGSLEKTIKNICRLREKNINVEVKTMVMRENYMELEEIKRFCDAKKIPFSIDATLFKGLKKCGKIEQHEIDTAQYKKILYMIKNENEKVSSNMPICPETRNIVTVLHNGNIVPCIKMQVKLGNVYSDKIEKIWNESELLNKIREYKWKDLNECYNCKEKGVCQRCTGIVLEETGNMLGKCDKICMRTKIAMEELKNGLKFEKHSN